MKAALYLIHTVMFVFIFQISFAQEEAKENSLHQRVSFIISHTHIPASTENSGGKKTFIAASIGANYELWFNSRWAVGLHTDLTMQSFTIEAKADEAFVKKEFPLLTSLVAVYKPARHWIFFAGPGKEFENEENLNVIKTGVEYGIAIPKNWEISFGADYDFRINAYNTWLIGIGISKVFLRK